MQITAVNLGNYNPPLCELSSRLVQLFHFISFQGSKTLLLHSLISQEQDTNIDTKAQIKTPANPGLPKTKKRKHMSALERDKADKERERAIMAYRQLRKQRLQEKNEAVWSIKRVAWVSRVAWASRVDCTTDNSRENLLRTFRCHANES